MFLHPVREEGLESTAGSDVHADAIIDRIVHDTLWIETGSINMREHTAITA